MIVFGGHQGYVSTNEVWVLSIGEDPHWTPLLPAGSPPAARSQAAAIFDPLRDRMILFGGSWDADYEDEVMYGDTWSLELDPAPRWVQLSTAGTLPPRCKGASAVYDPFSDRMVLFGGWTGVSGLNARTLNDTWTLTLSGEPRWDRLAASNAPPERQETAAVVDTRRRRMIVSGGNGWQWSHTMNDTWALPLDGTAVPTWTRLPTGDQGRSVDQHAAIYSPERDALVQYGGEGAGNLCFELELQRNEWSQVNSDVTGPFPIRRVLPTLIADPVQPRLRLFGGGWGCKHDFWEMALDDP